MEKVIVHKAAQIKTWRFASLSEAFAVPGATVGSTIEIVRPRTHVDASLILAIEYLKLNGYINDDPLRKPVLN